MNVMIIIFLFIYFKDRSGRFPFLSCTCAEYCGLYLLTFLALGFLFLFYLLLYSLYHVYVVEHL